MARPAQPWYWKARDAWYVTINGDRYKLAEGRANKAEALKAFHRLMLADGKGPASRSLTVAELCDLFLEEMARRRQADEVSEFTVRWYARYLQSLCDHAGGQVATALRPLHLTAWIASHVWGRTSRHNAITAAKAVFRWGKRQGHVPEDPIAALDKPGAERREEVLSATQFQTILAATKDRPFRDFLTALWETGARPSEVYKVTAAEVDLDKKAWILKPKRQKTGRKTGRSRIIYLTESMVVLTRRLMAEHPEGPIFRNTRGGPWTTNSLACRFRRIRESHGYGGEVAAYAIRHRFVTDALLAEVSVATVSALVGHVDTHMVSRTYNHINNHNDHLSRSVGKVRPPSHSGDMAPGTPLEHADDRGMGHAKKPTEMTRPVTLPGQPPDLRD